MLIVLLLILAVVLALGMSFFAMQNPANVTIALAAWKWENVPLFLVVLLSLLLGLLIAWLFGLLSSISSSLTIFGKDVKLKKSNHDVDQLSKRISDLETENSNLKTQLKTV